MNITDLNAETRALCDADTTSYPAADLLRRINAAYAEVIGDIIAADGTWQFDDTNYTDFPIATTDLIAGQQNYAFLSSMLEIERVEVRNADGYWQQLRSLDNSGIDEAVGEYQKTAGLPQEYDKQGTSIVLYPSPAASAVTLSGGLKVYHQRGAALFTSAEVTTGTKEPGFASPFHIILAYKAALPFCMSYKKDRVALYVNEITRLRKELLNFYGQREKDVRKKITTSPISHR